MLELGGQDAAPAEELIKDGGDATFMQDVIEASQTVPVIVDFWAPWCGPCKTLGPALEEAVKAAGGRVKMVKVDVDQNQAVAGQLRVQSIPTVYAFHQGQPVDGFQGALPPSEVTAFVNKIADLGGEADNGLADAVEAAEAMLAEGAAADAAETFAAILQEDPNNAASYGGLARAYLSMDQVDQAEAVINGAPAEITDAAEIDAARAAIELAKQAADAGPVAELRAKVDADADDHEARFDLAVALNASGDAEAAVAELLELFQRDRDWNDGAAKTQ
ncbi:MAG: thioredoxin, partial [Pseudomonadota bacterium]